MPILSIQQQLGVPVGTKPMTWIINTTDTIATVRAAGYLNQSLKLGYAFAPGDIAQVITSDNGTVISVININNRIITLAPIDNPNNIVLPTSVNVIAHFTDTQGTQSSAAANVSNNGSISAVGALTALSPSANMGSVALQAVNNNGNYNTTIKNSSGSSRNIVATIPDIGSSNSTFMMTTLSSYDDPANMVAFDMFIPYNALSGSLQFILYEASSTTAQYIIRELYLGIGTNFSGGNRSINISDGETSYSIIPAATLQNLTNAMWGSTALPFPSLAPVNQSTFVGDSLFAQYTGGTTDYTGGSFVLGGLMERIA